MLWNVHSNVSALDRCLLREEMNLQGVNPDNPLESPRERASTKAEGIAATDRCTDHTQFAENEHPPFAPTDTTST